VESDPYLAESLDAFSCDLYAKTAIGIPIAVPSISRTHLSGSSIEAKAITTRKAHRSSASKSDKFKPRLVKESIAVVLEATAPRTLGRI